MGVADTSGPLALRPADRVDKDWSGKDYSPWSEWIWDYGQNKYYRYRTTPYGSEHMYEKGPRGSKAIWEPAHTTIGNLQTGGEVNVYEPPTPSGQYRKITRSLQDLSVEDSCRQYYFLIKKKDETWSSRIPTFLDSASDANFTTWRQLCELGYTVQDLDRQNCQSYDEDDPTNEGYGRLALRYKGPETGRSERVYFYVVNELPRPFILGLTATLNEMGQMAIKDQKKKKKSNIN